MRLFGIVLVIAGILAIVYGGFNYTKQRTVIDVGPIEAKVDEKKSVPISPLVGGGILIAGLAIVLAGRKTA